MSYKAQTYDYSNHTKLFVNIQKQLQHILYTPRHKSKH